MAPGSMPSKPSTVMRLDWAESVRSMTIAPPWMTLVRSAVEPPSLSALTAWLTISSVMPRFRPRAAILSRMKTASLPSSVAESVIMWVSSTITMTHGQSAVALKFFRPSRADSATRCCSRA